MNPLVDTLLQWMHIWDIAIASGILTFDLIDQYESIERNCLSTYHINPEAAQGKCSSLLSFLSTIDGGIDNADVRFFGNNASAQETIVNEYLNLKEV